MYVRGCLLLLFCFVFICSGGGGGGLGFVCLFISFLFYFFCIRFSSPIILSTLPSQRRKSFAVSTPRLRGREPFQTHWHSPVR